MEIIFYILFKIMNANLYVFLTFFVFKKCFEIQIGKFFHFFIDCRNWKVFFRLEGISFTLLKYLLTNLELQLTFNFEVLSSLEPIIDAG